MNKILLLFLIISGSLNAQTKVEVKKEGAVPVVTEFEGKSAQELYLQTKKWIQSNYKNPSEVLKGDIENDMLRINGYGSGFFYVKSIIKNYYDVEYSIEFLFKDGKYKYIFTINKITTQGRKIYFSVPSDFFKSDGTTVRTIYADGYESLSASINALYLSHFNYISGKTESKKNDW